MELKAHLRCSEGVPSVIDLARRSSSPSANDGVGSYVRDTSGGCAGSQAGFGMSDGSGKGGKVRVIFALFGLFANASIEASAATRRSPALPLQTMTFDEIQAARAAGTGCTWLGGKGMTVKVAMKEDRGLVKRRGRIIRLRPARGAPEVFPYTFHHWQGGGMDIRITDRGSVVDRGSEHVETTALLTLKEGNSRRTWQGRLNCGS